MRQIKFRAWDKLNNEMTYFGLFELPTAFWGKEVQIMQFTGLTDKNYRDIYEGDIVKRIGIPHVIKWQEEKARFVCFNPQLKNPSYWGVTSPAKKDYHFEIIGNIYENKNLLTP